MSEWPRGGPLISFSNKVQLFQLSTEMVNLLKSRGDLTETTCVVFQSVVRDHLL